MAFAPSLFRGTGVWTFSLAFLQTLRQLLVPFGVYWFGQQRSWWLFAVSAALFLPEAWWRSVLRNRLRPLLCERVTLRALQFYRENRTGHTVAWSAQLAENLLLQYIPGFSAAAIMALCALLLALWTATLQLQAPLLAAGMLSALVLLLWRSSVRTANEVRIKAMLRTSSWLYGAATQSGEIRGKESAAYFSHRTSAHALHWSRVEAQQERLQWLRKTVVATIFLAPLLVFSLYQWTLIPSFRSEWFRSLALLFIAVPAVLSVLRLLEDLRVTWIELEQLGLLNAPIEQETVSFPATAENVTIENVSVFYGKKPALQAITAKLPIRGLTVILGPNGAGKTTLASVLSGVRTPTQGSISLGGVLVGNIDPGCIQFVPQEPLLLEEETVFENLRLLVPALSETEAERAIEEVGLRGTLQQSVRALSRGQQRRVALLRALLCKPKVLVLDEPETSFDLLARQKLFSQLQTYAKDHSVVLVTHRKEFAAHATQLLLLSSEHRLVYAGSPETEEAQQCLQSVLQEE